MTRRQFLAWLCWLDENRAHAELARMFGAEAPAEADSIEASKAAWVKATGGRVTRQRISRAEAVKRGFLRE